MNAQTRYVVPHFETLSIQDYFYIELRKASECFIQYPENLKNAPSFHVKNGQLSVYATTTKAIVNSALRSREPIIIGYQNLKQIDLEGVVKLLGVDVIEEAQLSLSFTGACQVDLSINVSHLDTYVEGASTVRLEGRASQHDLTVTGMANIQAIRLLSDETILSSEGACKVSLNSQIVSGEAGGMSIINLGPQTKSIDIENTGMSRVVEVSDTGRSAYHVMSFEETRILRHPRVEYRNTDSTVSYDANGSSKGFDLKLDSTAAKPHQIIETKLEEVKTEPVNIINPLENEDESTYQEISRERESLQREVDAFRYEEIKNARYEIERARREIERSRREIEDMHRRLNYESSYSKNHHSDGSWHRDGAWNRTNRFDAHWAGFEIGFNGYGLPDNIFSINLPSGYDPMRLEFSKSVQFNLNLIDFSVGFGNSGIGIATGLGFSWNVYRFMNTSSTISLLNDRFEIAPYSGSELRRYEKSRLSASYFRIPIMLEVQTLRSGYASSFYFQVGVVGSVRMRSTARQLWESTEGGGEAKYRDHFYLAPFKADIEVRLGIGPIRFFASYGLTPLFVKNKGPQILPYSVGLTIFNF